MDQDPANSTRNDNVVVEKGAGNIHNNHNNMRNLVALFLSVVLMMMMVGVPWWQKTGVLGSGFGRPAVAGVRVRSDNDNDSSPTLTTSTAKESKGTRDADHKIKDTNNNQDQGNDNNNNNKFPIGPTTSQQIIVMGLPKTGTTSVAQALQALGYKVSHNQGDTLANGHCNVIANTLEMEYEQLSLKYPAATWIVTYSANATAWMESFAYHYSYHQKKFSLNKIRKVHDQFRIDTSILDDFPADQRDSVETGYRFLWHHRDVYLAFYEQYYARLVDYLTSRHLPQGDDNIPIVDVRAGSGYDVLAAVTRNGTRPVNARMPFPHANSKYHKGGWPRCK